MLSIQPWDFVWAIIDVAKWIVIGLGIVCSIFLYIVFDMFGAPHNRKKFFWEFWRSK